jgi:hypothetical protein
MCARVRGYRLPTLNLFRDVKYRDHTDLEIPGDRTETMPLRSLVADLVDLLGSIKPNVSYGLVVRIVPMILESCYRQHLAMERAGLRGC